MLPTGFGKSLLYQLLPDLIPRRILERNNIAIVVSPLNSIIEDQVKVLQGRRVKVGVLSCETRTSIQSLFSSNTKKVHVHNNVSNVNDDINDYYDEIKTLKIPTNILNGEVQILFSHPESLLSDEGRKLLKSKMYQNSVVACVIDEAHCMELW